jgi:hypothetical protein
MKARLARTMAVGLAVPLGIALAGATPGYAQFVGGGSGPSSINSAVNKNLKGAQSGQKPDIQPPVLPGTKAPSVAADPSAATASLSPTDALFDSINRGDLASAREAINRGADLDGRNLLGMTPLDLSVDLGRNDISFTLLSMRGDNGAPSRSGRRDADQRAGDAPPRVVNRPRVVAVSTRAPDEPVAARPRLYSGDGGSAIPAAGFLGFGEGRSSR